MPIVVNPKAKPKPWWKSKALWASLLGSLLGIYEVVQSYRPDLPRVSDALYLFLGSFGVFGLRMARRPIDWPGGGEPQRPALPDASDTSVVDAAYFEQRSAGVYPVDDAPMDYGTPGPGPR